MDTLSYKTISANANTVDKQWVLVDVADVPLGRAAAAIASLLRGKHKTSYTPHVDCGDNVVVVNAEKVKLTGKSGLKSNTFVIRATPEDSVSLLQSRYMLKTLPVWSKKPLRVCCLKISSGLICFATSAYMQEQTINMTPNNHKLLILTNASNGSDTHHRT